MILYLNASIVIFTYNWRREFILGEKFILCIYWFLIIFRWVNQFRSLFYFTSFWFFYSILFEIIVTQCNQFILNIIVLVRFLRLYKLLQFWDKTMNFKFIRLWFQILIYFHHMHYQLLDSLVFYFIKENFEIFIMWILFFFFMEPFFNGTLSYYIQYFLLWNYFLQFIIDFYFKAVKLLLKILNLISKVMNMCFVI